ncbi:response regulator [Pseudorhodobacter wandonensis]|uniref:response regulator n=1 Tax=Pseudorhodobacter wandonensis TaxID=1120568 RepID=UPI00067D5683|nr:response regulator [Pseudorhodobacter wandonensis]
MLFQDPNAKEEIKRQHDLLWRERWGRLPLTMLGIALTTIYLPLWIALVIGIMVLGAEIASMRYMRALDPRRHPARYLFVIFCTFVMELFFSLSAALIWQVDDDYAKPFAVGIIMVTLMQIISARTIHMAFGYVGFTAVALVTLVGNAVYWLGFDDYLGLGVSTLAANAVLIYTLIAMHSNNTLHRTAALDRKAALASNNAKSRFLAQMSHELRTPMNAILGMGHAEQRRAKDALSQNRLAVLISAAEGLSTILDDILDMSAIEAGRLPIRTERVVPSTEVLAVANLFQPAITEAGLALTHKIDPQLGKEWLLDPKRLRQCMSNLLSNALKNTQDGGIHVLADLASDASGAPQMRIEISDTGPGVPSHLHRSLFAPFSQAYRPLGGTESNGLGLSICRTMARQMGGDLTLAGNTEGQSGARFILTLKLGLPDVTDSPASVAQATQIPYPAAATTGLRVLVVDDIATNRLVASTYLRMLGAAMIEAESGAKALEIITTSCPDLILLDMNMPEMNGLQTLARIRSLPGPLAKIPVIAMTANAMAEHRAEYMASGVDGYLAKPITPARIEAEIKAVLDKKGRARSD